MRGRTTTTRGSRMMIRGSKEIIRRSGMEPEP